MFYIVFSGAVIFLALLVPSPVLAKSVLMAALTIVAITTLTTSIGSALLGGTTNIRETANTNIQSLSASLLIFVCAFQVAHSAPAIFIAAPILAVCASSLVLSRGLTLSLPRALFLCVVGGIAVHITFKVFSAPLLSLAVPTP